MTIWAIVTQSDEPFERGVVYRWENRGSRLRGIWFTVLGWERKRPCAKACRWPKELREVPGEQPERKYGPQITFGNNLNK